MQKFKTIIALVENKICYIKTKNINSTTYQFALK